MTTAPSTLLDAIGVLPSVTTQKNVIKFRENSKLNIYFAEASVQYKERLIYKASIRTKIRLVNSDKNFDWTMRPLRGR